MPDDLKVGRAAGQAMAHAMYRHTFGIVSDYQGMEGRGLGTGVGVVWRGTFMIATAKHAIADTAPQKLYYLLPGGTLEIPESQASIDWSKVRYQLRFILEKPRVLYASGDVAVILLPEQPTPAGKSHLYELEENQTTPAVDTNVGFLGYPAAAALPVGANYAAMPSHAFGKICAPGCEYDAGREFAVRYEPGDDLDPHGFSGSGVWYSRSTGKVWSPQICLAGIVTHYYRVSQVLICARIETLTAFLAGNL
jgi:hypothetical protein